MRVLSGVRWLEVSAEEVVAVILTPCMRRRCIAITFTMHNIRLYWVGYISNARYGEGGGVLH